MDTRVFYDELAARYDLMYADWDASIDKQGRALDTLLTKSLGPGPHKVLDNACGIGTQALGLARLGHRVTGTDLSPVATARAAREAAARGLSLSVAAADMRALPFPAASFDAVVCADNALPHLLRAEDVRAALAETRRVLRPGGLLLLSTRPYGALRRTRPASEAPRVRTGPDGRTVTFQLWHWHEDGERYDVELFQLLPSGGTWAASASTTTYWALAEEETAQYVRQSGFGEPVWHSAEDTGFHQPVLGARRPVPRTRSTE
ncbi:class I SAM-dependent methyltransferase [Streptomyces sp. NBC_00249]|uniref:class I SAM-dependent methyltransferase n=1 Tax=Streptomyces sp. NBC_00249 TaxID=2975690 RepID=UPI00224EF9A5|nr:class I SAM-dependent methyltransferase [Streptomyces sp. NBC_00249]MCX5196622.1 class I SAM-dependent methyltransferase [Streptomyces sp. NBC_00249]